MDEYVEPKLLTELEHKHYTHICGKSPREGLLCDCPRETQLKCLRGHTTQQSLIGLKRQGLSEKEALKAYWQGVPEFIRLVPKRGKASD